MFWEEIILNQEFSTQPESTQWEDNDMQVFIDTQELRNRPSLQLRFVHGWFT